MAGVLFALVDAGVFRSRESGFIGFLEALQEMSRSWRSKTQEGELTVPLTVNAE
jgi:hypothetical protein